MVNYFYNKYNAVATPVYGYTIKWTAYGNSGVSSVAGYPSYNLDVSTGILTDAGIQKTLTGTESGSVYTVVQSGTKVVRYEAVGSGNLMSEIGTPENGQINTTYSKGTLVQSNISAAEGTYPIDGRHTDGYWYTRGDMVPQYYYSKYSTVSNPVYNWSVKWSGESITSYESATGYTSYNLNSSTGIFTTAGSPGDIVKGGTGTLYYVERGDLLYKYTARNSTIYQDIGTPEKTQTDTTYSKGGLLQANIVANDGAYPENGRHTDGYWYVKGSLVDTKPSPPAKFTQPIGSTLEIGDTKVIAWDSSSNPTGGGVKYSLDISINNAAWQNIANNLVQSTYNYKIPTATSIKFRVRAVDSVNSSSVSDYTESTSFTVADPLYYWSKYENKQNLSWKRDTVNYITFVRMEQGWEPHQFFEGKILYNVRRIFQEVGIPVTTITDAYIGDRYETPETSSNMINEYTPVVTTYLYEGVARHDPYHGYFKMGGKDYIFRGTLLYFDDAQPKPPNPGVVKYVDFSVLEVAYTSTLISEEKGTLIQSNVKAKYDAYQNDKKHTDGYWYVRGSRVSDVIAPPSGFTEPLKGKIMLPTDTNIKVKFGNSLATGISLYEVDYRYNSKAWVKMDYSTSLERTLASLSNLTEDNKIQFRVRAKDTNNIYSDYVYSNIYDINHTKVIFNSVLDKDDKIIAETSTNTIPRETTFPIYITIDEKNTSNSISLDVKINSTLIYSGISLARLEKSSISLLYTNLTYGQNNIELTAKDDYNSATKYNFSIIVDENVPVGYSCLSHMKFNGYSKQTLSLAEIVNHLED